MPERNTTSWLLSAEGHQLYPTFGRTGLATYEHGTVSRDSSRRAPDEASRVTEDELDGDWAGSLPSLVRDGEGTL